MGLFFACPIGAYLGGRLAAHGLGKLLGVGFTLYALFYLALFALGLAHLLNAAFLIGLGLVQGLGLGIYSIAVNVLTYDLVGDARREAYFAQLQMAGNAIAVVGPIAAGAVVDRFSVLGYGVVFLSAFTVFFFAAGAAQSLAFKARKRAFMVGKVLTTPRPIWRMTLAMYVLQGCRDGLFSFAFGLALYYVLKNAATYGIEMGIFAAVSIASSYLVGRYSRPEWRSGAMWVGGIIQSLAIVYMSLFLSPLSLIIYGFAVNAAFQIWFIPFNAVSFEAIRRAGLSLLRTESLSAREVALGTGRMLILITSALLVWKMGEKGLRLAMLISVPPFLVSILLAQIITTGGLRRGKQTPAVPSAKAAR